MNFIGELQQTTKLAKHAMRRMELHSMRSSHLGAVVHEIEKSCKLAASMGNYEFEIEEELFLQRHKIKEQELSNVLDALGLRYDHSFSSNPSNELRFISWKKK